jgi:Holliday junction resolvase-like predicted endonuclease
VRLPTASKLDLARACSFWLSPHAPKAPPYVESEHAALGNEVHAMVEAAIKGADYTPSSVGLVYSVSVSNYVNLHLPAGERYSEIAMAWDCETRTARLLPSNGQRDYTQRRANEIVGTADVVVVDGSRVVVSDVKTGRGAREEAARNSGQLRFLALCAARVFGATDIEIELYHMDQDSDRSYPDRHTLDPFDLFDIEDEIDAIYREVKGGAQVPRSGPHCYGKWCPIAATCPATMAMLARIDEEAASGLPMVPTIENDEQARRVRIGLKMVEEHIEAKVAAWKTALQEYVSRNGAVELGNGKWYGAHEKSRDVVSISHEHIDLLKRLMGDDAMSAAVEVKTSKSAIEKALKERQTKRGEGVAKARQLYEALRQDGAMRRSTFVVFEDFKKTDSNDDEGEAA